MRLPSFHSYFSLSVLPLITTLLATAPETKAATYTWLGTTNNNWNNGTNWAGGTTPATVAGDTVDASTLTLTADKFFALNNGTSTLNRTVGTLVFGDVGDAFGWTLNHNGGGTSTPNLIFAVPPGSGTGTVNVVNQSLRINPIIAGNQGLAKTGNGTLTLGNAGNTITGGIFLNDGQLSFVNGALGNNLVSVNGDTTLNWTGAGGTPNTADISGQLFLGDGVTLNLGLNNTDATLNTVFASTIQTGSLKTGRIIKQNISTLTITGQQFFTDGARINNGLLILAGGDNRLAPTGQLRFGNNANSGVLQLGNAGGASNQGTSGFTYFGTGTDHAIVGGNSGKASILTVNNTGTTTAPILGGEGAAANSLALVKAGAGTLNLVQSSTYTGGTTVSGGMLRVNNTSGSGTGSGAVIVSGTGTLGGSGTVGGATAIQSGGTLSPGNSPGNLTFTGGLTFQPGAVLQAELLFGGTVSDSLTVAGGTNLTGATLQGTWGGSSANLFQGAYTASDMIWLINNTDAAAITGTFANSSLNPALAGLFGGVTPYLASVGGQDFALFYNSQFGNFSQAGLSGGNDLLLIPVQVVQSAPEPSRGMLALGGALALLARRRRAKA